MALATMLNTLVRFVPIGRIGVTTTAAICATTRPYSTTVPRQSLRTTWRLDHGWLAAADSPAPGPPAATAASTLS